MRWLRVFWAKPCVSHGRFDYRPIVPERMNSRLFQAFLFILAACVAGLSACHADAELEAIKKRDFGKDLEALAAVEQKVFSAAGDPTAARELEDVLTNLLHSAASPAAFDFTCRQLRLIASARAVPVLAQMLADARSSHSARSVLEVVPGPAPAAALRRALRETRGDQLVGVINSLGERRERESVSALVTMLSNREPAVVRAAIGALGKVGGDEATSALRSLGQSLDPSLFPSNKAQITLAPQVSYRLNMALVFDALLLCADRMALEGNTGPAVELCARLAASDQAPWPGRVAAIQALLGYDPSRATPFVTDMLRNTDPVMQATAAGFVRRLPSSALEPLLFLLDALPVTAQINMLEALADRGEASLLPVILKATRYSDPNARTAAIQCLAGFEANADVVQRLAQLAVIENGAPATAARQALGVLKGEAADAAILAGLKESGPAIRAELMRAAGRRGLKPALPEVCRAVSSDNLQLRIAGLEALGYLAGSEQRALVAERFLKAVFIEERIAAAGAFAAIARRGNDIEASARVLADALPVTDRETRPALYDALGHLGGVTALTAVSGAARNGEPADKERAITVLTRWPDSSALEELMAIAKTADNLRHHSIALRGFLSLIERPSARSPDQTLELYKQALAVALIEDDKNLIRSAVTKLSGVNAPDPAK